MSNLATAVDRARTVSGEKASARLYNDVEHELAWTDNEDDYEQGEQALHVLEDRFPGIAARAREITDPPRLSRRAGSRLRRGDHQQPVLGAKPRRQHQAQRRQARTLRQRAASATTIHARPRSSGRWAQTGIPAAGESVAEFTMRTIGIIAGLSFLYLLLSPRGSRAIQLASSGGVHALQALVSPNVDPLRASSKAQAGSRAGQMFAGNTLGQAAGLSGAIASVDSAMNAFDKAAGQAAGRDKGFSMKQRLTPAGVNPK